MKLKSIKGTLTYENDDLDLVASFQQRGYRTLPVLYVNGKEVPSDLAAQARPAQTLLSFLREVMGLTGSKLGCAEGGCGACTVMISRYDTLSGKVLHYSVNACLMPVLAADGCHVTTVEGVGTVKGDKLHPIQKSMVDMHGSQCGFCTPGIIVAMYSLFANNPSQEYIEEHLDGNLCRCTGYRPIWDAARSLCLDNDGVTRGPCGIACRDCPEHETCNMECNKSTKDSKLEEKKDDGLQKCCSSTTDKLSQYKDSFHKDPQAWLDQPNAMFPETLMSPPCTPLVVVDKSFHKAGSWFKPTTLTELLSLLNQFKGECKIVVGNTEVGIETKFKHSVFPRLIFPSQSIESIFSVSEEHDYLQIGSCVPLSTIQHKCSELMVGGDFARIAKPIHDMLRWFASTQIRNVACLGGNLATASPISDMNPMLACMNATLVIVSCADGTNIVKRTVPVTEFFLSYRNVDLKPDEFIECIQVPKTDAVFEYVVPFKQARRREDDISIVTSGMRIALVPSKESYVIKSCSLAYGGMAPKTVMATATEEYLKGKVFSLDTFHEARKVLLNEFQLPDQVPGGQAQYRMTLACSFLHKFYHTVVKLLSGDVEDILKNKGSFPQYSDLPATPTVCSEDQCADDSFVSTKKPSTKGTQNFPAPKVYKGLESAKNPDSMAASAVNSGGKDEVGKPSAHASGPLHCTGEAVYTDDVPLPPGSLHASLVLASSCNVKLLSIDTSVALDTPGVVAVYTHEDIQKIGGDNTLGPIVHDEFVFLPVGEMVQFVGQVIGICIGKTLESSEAGARAVQLQYGEMSEEPIVSIEDAIEANSFYEFSRHKLDRNEPLETSEGDEIVTVSGSFRCGGQEHFYLETNSTLAVPSESGTNLTVYCSTQAVTETQMHCASATNLPASKVVVKMKRMGGGFGGKETRSVFTSCAAAVAAKISGSPVRLTLGRDVDMAITGGRHAFLANYEASAVIRSDKTVKLKCLNIKLFSNGGCAFDLSGPVMDRALFHVDGPYYWPEFHAEGVPCRTVQPPHTAFRGFGGPQGLAACEHVLDHLANKCGISGEQIREQNLYSNGQTTPFGMIMGEKCAGKWNVPKMWKLQYDELNYEARKQAIADFNAKHKYKKRGMCLLPTKFGIAFTTKFMNQGGALVHVYTDGTVLVSHGGTEMGQGLHTKVCQIAAQAFQIPLNDVYVNDTSSDKVANTLPTAASMSTDMYGMATLDACHQILKRLEPIRKKLPTGASLKEIAKAAFFERVDLSAHGFFALDDSRCGFNWNLEKPSDFPDDAPQNSWKGHPFNYFTQGCACTEVEIDVLTGNHSTIRSDVLVDVGRSINPALDIGQIEGAFIQGMGWSTLEEVVYGDDDHTWIRPKGRTFTTGPGTYKIPAFNDVPEELNVSLMDNVDNPFAVHSSKAIGEPP